MSNQPDLGWWMISSGPYEQVWIPVMFIQLKIGSSSLGAMWAKDWAFQP
jgi:hypothetical protein